MFGKPSQHWPGSTEEENSQLLSESERLENDIELFAVGAAESDGEEQLHDSTSNDELPLTGPSLKSGVASREAGKSIYSLCPPGLSLTLHRI